MGCGACEGGRTAATEAAAGGVVMAGSLRRGGEWPAELPRAGVATAAGGTAVLSSSDANRSTLASCSTEANPLVDAAAEGGDEGCIKKPGRASDSVPGASVWWLPCAPLGPSLFMRRLARPLLLPPLPPALSASATSCGRRKAATGEDRRRGSSGAPRKRASLLPPRGLRLMAGDDDADGYGLVRARGAAP